MAVIYYIDSENVGDLWIKLLSEQENCENRFLVFYTGRSPRIAYSNVIELMNARNKPEFIKCYEGNNGLDFQLVSYLGYELCADCSKEMVIVSNDAGFDAAVFFWRERGMNVKRVSFSNNFNQQTIEKKESILENGEVCSGWMKEETEKIYKIDEREVYTIINCIGTENLAHIHAAFVYLYGKDDGKEIYQYMKAKKFEVPSVQWKKKTKMKKMMELILGHSGLENSSNLDSFFEFMMNQIEDDNGAMLNKMNTVYGEQGAQLHKIFKPFYKILLKIKENEM